jgi:hypothetical protein
MSSRSLCVKFVFGALLALLAPCLWAQDGLKGALSQAKFSGPFEQRLAVADLDDDKKPDGAVLLDSGPSRPQSSFRLELHFTGHPNAEFTFESSERALTLAAWDVDHDGETDIVVEQALTHKPLYVWINKGNGDFHQGRVQDFPSLGLRSREQLQPPSSQTDCLAQCLPAQRGFEIAILTAPLLARPPSDRELQIVSTHLFVLSAARTPSLSRAPPLS